MARARTRLHSRDDRRDASPDMTSSSTQVRTPTSTRERILDAALDLFVDRGVAGTSVSDIERAVGLAAGTGSFYRHFRSKEDVLLASFQRAVARLVEETAAERAAVTNIADPVERRARDCEVLLAEMQRFQPLWQLVVVERDRFPELHRIFTEALGVAHWTFGWGDDPSYAVTVAALAGFHQFTLMDAAPYRDISPTEFIAVLVELTSRDERRTRGRKRS
jgi:AcrR family transcriptional regulator